MDSINYLLRELLTTGEVYTLNLIIIESIPPHR